MNITEYIDPKEYPDWRWTRVKGMLKDRVAPTRKDDKYIHRGYRFAKELESCDGSDSAMFSLSMKHRDIGKAIGLNNNRSNRKYYIEALALCWDADEAAIAKYMGESQFTVRYYLKMFFDVRDKLDSVGYICSRIMEPALMRSIQDCKDSNIAWKLAALFGGFDAVLACWENKAIKPKVQKHFKQAGMGALLKDFGLGTFLRPLNRFNIELVADHVLRAAELEIKAQESTGATSVGEDQTAVLKNIMGSMKFFVTDPTKQLPAKEPRLFEKVDQALVSVAVE